MEEKTAKLIMAGLGEPRPVSVRVEGRRWRWATGVHVFPEAICPFCNATMRSTCLWWIDDKRAMLKRVVGVTNGRLKSLPVVHPHVGYDGYICLGSRTDTTASQALLMGLNPYSAMGMFAGEHRRTNPAWKQFFAAYFSDHRHVPGRRRARPKLFGSK